MNKLRWGVLGTSHFAKTKFLPALQQCRHAEFTAVASRTLETARSLAAQLGIERAYGSYDELLADPAVDVIYNPLPNHLHVPWSIQALEAGKHVCAESPSGCRRHAQLLLDTASRHPDLKVMKHSCTGFNRMAVVVEQAVNDS
jgi:predicted dehydrogenase